MQNPSFPLCFVPGVVAAWCLLAGCTPTEPYHKELTRVGQVQIRDGQMASPSPGGTAVEEISGEGAHCKLAFIEFGEQGSLQAAAQVTKARQLIQDIRRPVVITYLHGWHNNAAPDCGDVLRFKRLLAGLSRSPSVTNGGFQVVGVYLGWRGEIISASPFKYLTVFNRKQAAERLANNIDCIDAISQITAEARRKGRENNYTVLIGHSFGGLVLERTVAHSIVTSIDQTGASETLPGDLIITLNPASDSILTRQLVSSLYARMDYDAQRGQYVGTTNRDYTFPGYRQVIVAIAADNDGATNKFPYAFWPGTATKKWDPVLRPGAKTDTEPRSEWDYYLHTPGNDWDLINFRAREVERLAGQPPGDFDRGRDGNALQYNLRHNHTDNEFYTSAGMDSDNAADTSQWKRWRLEWNSYSPRTPYWIIRVPPQIINNHGGIWSENSLAMMAAIYRMNFPLPPKTVARAPTAPPPAAGPRPAVPVPFRAPPLPAANRVFSARRDLPTTTATPPPTPAPAR